MRKFNPEKELNKIQNGNKNKIIIGLCTLLLIVVVGYSFALYQVRHTNKLIFTTVGKFSNKDINLAIYVDNDKQDTFPDKNNYFFDKVVCDNNSYWEFDYDNWELMLKTNKKDNCDIYFTKNYRDRSRANAPELYQGMLPIYFNDGKIYIADVTKEWYDYDKHNWGNAVLIDNNNADIKNKFYKEDGTLKVDTEVQESNILQMYVWIPRYKYQLFNAISRQSSEPQMINIAFETGDKTTGTVSCSTETNGKETCINAENGNWYTHPAFTFGDTELSGIWVGKFELSDLKDEIGRNTYVGEIAILPNRTSMVNKTISTVFEAVRSLETVENKYHLSSQEVDTHIIKNLEWGAMAYLTSSKYGIYSNDGQKCMIDGMPKENCEVWINNTAQGTYANDKLGYGGTYTGCVGESVSSAVVWNNENNAPAKCDADKRWNTANGVKASTTGNVYGVYDTSGGVWDYVMGVITDENGTDLLYLDSGFTKETMPNKKYYDVYEYGTSNTSQERGHLGDSSRETLTIVGDRFGGWNNDTIDFPYDDKKNGTTWFLRGGSYDFSSGAGIFAVGKWAAAHPRAAFRSVLTAQDSNE